MKSAIGMVGVVIFGVGSTVWGLVADTFGRKIVILVSLFFGATFNLVGSFSTSYLMYFALYVLAGLCINGTYVQPFVLTVELVDKVSVLFFFGGGVFFLARGHFISHIPCYIRLGSILECYPKHQPNLSL